MQAYLLQFIFNGLNMICADYAIFHFRVPDPIRMWLSFMVSNFDWILCWITHKRFLIFLPSIVVMIRSILRYDINWNFRLLLLCGHYWILIIIYSYDKESIIFIWSLCRQRVQDLCSFLRGSLSHSKQIVETTNYFSITVSFGNNCKWHVGNPWHIFSFRCFLIF